MSVYSKNRYNKHQPNDAWFKIFQFIEADTRILDIGCSSGKLGAALKKEKNVYVIGLDIDGADIKLAQKNLDEAYIGNVEQDDLSKYDNFDYIIMADVIEHLVDPVSALKKVKLLLKPGGKLVFSIPNMANVTTRIDLLQGRFAYKEFGLLDKTHLHFYDQQEVGHVFNEAGLVVEKTDCTLRPIPADILAKELQKIGIELTQKLEGVLNNDDSIIYQFIGIARVGKPVAFKPQSTTHLDVISLQIEDIRTEFIQEIEKMKGEINALEEENRRLDEELSSILNSKGWKALSKAYSLKQKLSPKRKQ